jgi:hypothetical protein
MVTSRKEWLVAGRPGDFRDQRVAASNDGLFAKRKE